MTSCFGRVSHKILDGCFHFQSSLIFSELPIGPILLEIKSKFDTTRVAWKNSSQIFVTGSSGNRRKWSCRFCTEVERRLVENYQGKWGFDPLRKAVAPPVDTRLLRKAMGCQTGLESTLDGFADERSVESWRALSRPSWSNTPLEIFSFYG